MTDHAPELAAITLVCVPAALIVLLMAVPVIGVSVLRKRVRRWRACG